MEFGFYQLVLSFKNILTVCASCNQVQRQYYVRTNLKDIFNHSPVKNILDFIKNVYLYDKL